MSGKQKAPDAQANAKPIGSRLKKVSLGAAACVACTSTGTHVRPPPPPEKCPPGAYQFMSDTLRIGRPGEHFADMPIILPSTNERSNTISVREGPIRVEIPSWGKLPTKTVLSGRLLIGPERVHGRFTQATLPDGETYSVCFAMRESGSYEQGIPIESGDGPDAVLVSRFVTLEMVGSFK